MRLLLVYPRFPLTYWGFQHSMPLIGRRASLPPLGLITVAALLPPDIELRLVDENVEPLRDEDLVWADAALVSGMRVQAPGMHDVLSRARAAGLRTVVGGPAASATPDEFEDADFVFVGEAEGRADEIMSAVFGRAPRVLKSAKLPDLESSPVPRYELLRKGRYSSMSLQYSRGCPFRCEFCDVIELFGRTPRVKASAQVVAELEAIRQSGFRGSVFFVDDNFIGNKRHVRKTLPKVRAWQEAHGNPFDLFTEASVNLAADAPLVQSMVDAGFSSVFLGIESPSAAALEGAGKKQNVALDLRQAIDSLTRSGLEVFGGFIVGFDEDGPEAFEAQREFISSLPIPLAMVGMLTALPGTALWRRLEREGRLQELASGDPFDRPNFLPKMGEAQLLRGYAKLLGHLYSPAAYFERCRAFIERIGRAPTARRVVRANDVLTLLRAVLHLGVLGRRRRWFWRLFVHALRRAPHAFAQSIAHAVMGEHMIRYTHEHVLPRIDRALAELAAESPESQPTPRRLLPIVGPGGPEAIAAAQVSA